MCPWCSADTLKAHSVINGEWEVTVKGRCVNCLAQVVVSYAVPDEQGPVTHDEAPRVSPQ